MKISTHIFTVLFLESIALCLIASFRFISLESTFTLLIFNLLFFLPQCPIVQLRQQEDGLASYRQLYRFSMEFLPKPLCYNRSRAFRRGIQCILHADAAHFQFHVDRILLVS